MLRSARQARGRAQAVAETQANVELRAIVHEMQMMTAVRGIGEAQEAPMSGRRVERLREAIASVPNERRDRRVEIVNERDHVDGLAASPGTAVEPKW